MHRPVTEGTAPTLPAGTATTTSEDVGATSAIRTGVRVHLTLGEIFSHSTIEVSACAPEPFRLNFRDRAVFSMDVGTQEDESTIRAVRAGEQYEIRTRIVGAIAHVPVDQNAQLHHGIAPGVSRAEYTVRFFPFVSSSVFLSVRSSPLPIQELAVIDTDDVRSIWSPTSLVDERSNVLPRQSAHFPGGWSQALRWQDPPLQPHEAVLTLPVRASGRALVKAILYPTVTWVAGLMGIALAVAFANTGVALTAVAAVWAFLLREWTMSPRAHQVNLATAMFALQALGAGLWAGAIAVGGWAIAAVSTVFLLVVLLLIRLATRFEYSGRLPRWIDRPWGRVAVLLEKRRAAARAALGVSEFDYRESRMQDDAR